MSIITPNTFDPLHRYVNVRIGQGVPLVHADLNELDDIRNFEVRAFLKWFVGDGVPEGSEGAFRITGNNSADNVAISAGVGAAPAGLDKLSTGLSYVGRCIVDGRDALIGANTTFADQALHDSQPGATTLAADWGVSTVPAFPNVAGTLLLYLDVWDRLVTPTEQPALVFAGLGVESASRMRREWVVRWTTNATAPVFGDPAYVAGHSYYALATVTRRLGDPVVTASDVTDLRERRLLVPPASLIEDVLGSTPTRYRRGLDRPTISLRDALNALLRGELPSSPDAPIAPFAGGDDDMSYAFDFIGPDIAGFWFSNRAAAVDQIFGVRWPQSDSAAAATAPPQQITTGATPHRLPHALTVPTGDLVVTYETNGRDVHFRRGPHLAGLAAATETAVATDAARFERHPHVIRNGSFLVFFWHQDAPAGRWMYRRRLYTAAWDEAGATWPDPAGVEISSLVPSGPLGTVGGFHAIAVGPRVYVAFRTQTNDIAVAALNPATAAVDTWANLAFAAPGAVVDEMPYLVTNGTTSLWVFWRGADQGIFHERLDLATNTWAGTGSVVPGTNGPGLDTRPAAVCDDSGAVWLFWVSDRGGNNDIWMARRNPLTGGWGDPRQVVAATGNDDVPFARIGAGGVIWLFWRSSRTGQFDLYFKRLVTAV